MKKKVFWIGYIIFASVLIIAVASSVHYVNRILTEYEASQPEQLVKQQLELIRRAADTDSLEELLTFYVPEQAEYDIDISDFREYKNRVKNAAELTYRLQSGGYSESGQVYQLLADGSPFARLTLASSNERIRLAILTVCDWQAVSLTPVMTLTNYDYTIEVPSGYRVTINGTALHHTQPSDTEGWLIYPVETLYTEPVIAIYDSYGTSVLYNIADNHITPIVYTYHLKLPAGFRVFDGGHVQEGTTVGTTVSYSILSSSDFLVLEDSHGNSVEYRGGDTIYTQDYLLKLPDNFSGTINGRPLSTYKTAQEEQKQYRYCAEYATMPALVTYEIKNSLCEPEVVLYDNLQQPLLCHFENCRFECTAQTGLPAMPEQIKQPPQVLEIAKTWSKFMTDDLPGEKHGFSTMRKYLLKDSYLYQVAYRWVTGIDITFLSRHVLETPPFSEEKISNFVSYSDTLFSCDISFLKHMYLDTKDMHVIDETNSTFYFLYCEAANQEPAHWVLIDIQEIVADK